MPGDDLPSPPLSSRPFLSPLSPTCESLPNNILSSFLRSLPCLLPSLLPLLPSLHPPCVREQLPRRGNPRLTGGDSFSVKAMAKGGELKLDACVIDQGDGTYEARLKPTVAACYTLRVQLHTGAMASEVEAPPECKQLQAMRRIPLPTLRSAPFFAPRFLPSLLRIYCLPNPSPRPHSSHPSNRSHRLHPKPLLFACLSLRFVPLSPPQAPVARYL